MSAQNTLLTAVGATERGAFEYLPKPFDLDDLLAAAERALSPAAPVRQARADARAAQMGFGNELISALRNVDKHEIQKGMRLRPTLSTSTHPPAGTRVAKLEVLLKRDVAHNRRSIRRHQ
jgi:DNA-binding response OmpR family regulator